MKSRTITYIITILTVISLIFNVNNTVKADRIIGDVNRDNALNSIDASQVLNAYALMSVGKSTNISMFVADYNNDGYVNAVDASQILRDYARLSTGQPITFVFIEDEYEENV